MHIFHFLCTMKLLLLTFCDPTAETGVNFQTEGRRQKDRQTWKLKYLFRLKLFPRFPKNFDIRGIKDIIL